VAAAGRPLKPLAADAPPAAGRLAAELRRLRLQHGLTLAEVARRAGYSPQHVSSLELAATGATPSCVAALDAALDAGGSLLELLPAVVAERLVAADDRAAARRYDDEDVEPTNRRGLLGGAAGAALGAAALGAAPAAAREVDPELSAHWSALLRLLGRHDELFGPRDVLDTVQRELRLIAEHRQVARGELRTALMRVESRWAELAAWLSEDSGQSRPRDTWIDRALRLAQEADYPDMAAFARARQSEWASDAHRAVAYAKDALRTPGASAQTRAWCSRQAALGTAMAGDASDCERWLADAYGLLDAESPAPPWAGEYRVARAGTLAAQARCWAVLDPSKAIGFYDDALRDWPRGEARDGGLHRARLALACAATGELDRARAEGTRALAIAKQTRSASAARELRQLRVALAAA